WAVRRTPGERRGTPAPSVSSTCARAPRQAACLDESMAMSTSVSAGPTIGSHVPVIEAGETASTRAEPRVLAFLHAGGFEHDSAAIAAIRAGLRGLGAELLVLSPEGAWWLRA